MGMYMTKNNKFAFKQLEQKMIKVREKNYLLGIEPENNKEEYLMSLPLEKCLQKNSRGGLTGL